MNKFHSSKVILDEANICQLVAVLEKMWPDVGGAKPDLKLVISNREPESPKPKFNRAMVDKLKTMIRAKWPDEFGPKRSHLTVIRGGKGAAVAELSP